MSKINPRGSLSGLFLSTTAIVTLLVILPVTSAAEGEILKVTTEDAVLDRSGDGIQDVIVKKKRAHYDVDFDGKFDITYSLHLSEYNTDSHREYIESGYDAKVFADITMEALDELCATDRDNARWFEDNFRELSYHAGGYTRLYLFSDSPLNDGRLTQKKHKGEYEYWISFNPDGTVRTVKKGDKKIALAEFDEETKTSSGKKLTLPRIHTAEDLAKVRAELAGLFE